MAITLNRPLFATLRYRLPISILLNGSSVFEPLICGSKKTLLLFRATFVSEPMGVYRRRILCG